jgi:hypothetical protein
MIDVRIYYEINNKTVPFLQKPGTARSARPQGYRQSGITRLGSVPQARDTYSVWPPAAPLTLGFFRVRKPVAEISVGQSTTRRPRLLANKIKENTNK